MKYAEPVKSLKMALWPLGDVTQWFGENPELYQKYGSTIAHNGIDIVRPYGEHMFSVVDGIVAQVKIQDGGYGGSVRIMRELGDGIWEDWVYAHCSKIIVKEGDRVFKGQHIANMGNTGFVVSNNTANGFWGANPYAGTHLHIGYRLLKEDKNGWRYSSFVPEVVALDYDNGYKGRMDPLPILRPPQLKSSIVEAKARKFNSKLLLNASEVLRKIDL